MERPNVGDAVLFRRHPGLEIVEGRVSHVWSPSRVNIELAPGEAALCAVHASCGSPDQVWAREEERGLLELSAQHGSPAARES